jgi:hypothetical protein
MVYRLGGVMNKELRGSDLARVMLKSGYRNIWCAVDDESDEQAMMDNDGNDFTAYIVAFEKGYFHSDGGMRWLYAVPIKIEEIESDY